MVEAMEERRREAAKALRLVLATGPGLEVEENIGYCSGGRGCTSCVQRNDAVDVPTLPQPTSRLVARAGWRNTVEIVLFEISTSMKPYPSVSRAYTSTLRPAIVVFDPRTTR